MMKKKVKQYVQQTQNGGRNREQVLKEFSRMLDDQVKQTEFPSKYERKKRPELLIKNVVLVLPLNIKFLLCRLRRLCSFFCNNKAILLAESRNWEKSVHCSWNKQMHPKFLSYERHIGRLELIL